jgi:hypothetical protein
VDPPRALGGKPVGLRRCRLAVDPPRALGGTRGLAMCTHHQPIFENCTRRIGGLNIEASNVTKRPDPPFSMFDLQSSSLGALVAE